MGTNFIGHYDKYIDKNNELLCFSIFRALYKKTKTHIAFVELEYFPDQAAPSKFNILPSSLAVYSLEEMLHQSERNAEISRNVSENIHMLHSATYTVCICIFEVGNIGRTPEGEKWARMAKFARESELTTESEHLTPESMFERINDGQRV